MKFVILVLSLFTLNSITAQVINVPDNAQKHFQAKYTAATDVKWINNVANYDVKFKSGTASCKAHYNIDGTWDFTEKFLKKEDAPEKVKESLSKSTYRSNTVKSFASIENNKGENMYRYEVKTGVTRTYVFFDAEGVLIKTNAVL